MLSCVLIAISCGLLCDAAVLRRAAWSVQRASLRGRRAASEMADLLYHSMVLLNKQVSGFVS